MFKRVSRKSSKVSIYQCSCGHKIISSDKGDTLKRECIKCLTAKTKTVKKPLKDTKSTKVVTETTKDNWVSSLISKITRKK